eukprot:309362-Prymnesium_polylepis.1
MLVIDPPPSGERTPSRDPRALLEASLTALVVLIRDSRAPHDCRYPWARLVGHRRRARGHPASGVRISNLFRLFSGVRMHKCFFGLLWKALCVKSQRVCIPEHLRTRRCAWCVCAL